MKGLQVFLVITFFAASAFAEDYCWHGQANDGDIQARVAIELEFTPASRFYTLTGMYSWRGVANQGGGPEFGSGYLLAGQFYLDLEHAGMWTINTETLHGQRCLPHSTGEYYVCSDRNGSIDPYTCRD